MNENFLNVLKNWNNSNKIGLVVIDDNNKMLLIEEKIDMINKTIYTLPSITIDQPNKEKLLEKVHKKYGIKLNNITAYIDDFSLLDENCNNILQVNFLADLNIDENYKKVNYLWCTLDEAIEKVPIKIKETLKIYEYNFL